MAVWLKVLLVILTLLAFYFVFLQIQLLSCLNTRPHLLTLPEVILRPSVKIYDINPSDSHLHIVKSVFLKIGYNVVGGNETSWDVLWSHPYPFYALHKTMASLTQHQKVNHFPGSGFITQKKNLVSLGVRNTPKAYMMPDQKQLLLKYSQRNPGKVWVQKSNNHRGIRIVDFSNLDLNSKGIFIQEFIHRPLLINQRKFDIGVYVVLTSVNPLRVYVYSGDVLLRFCTAKYYPFNASNLESYVVGNDYLPVWKVPELKKLYAELNYTAKESLNAYLLSQKKNPKKLWSQVNEIVQDIFIKAESAIINHTQQLGHLRNFFELMRLDFVVDENLTAYILEANMSPNLSAEHFPQNRQLYEQVLFSVMSITGLIRKFPFLVPRQNELEVTEKDISVFIEGCSSQACNSSCKIQKCKVCNFCMTNELNSVAKQAYVEHVNKYKFQRVIPLPIDFKSSSTRIAKGYPVGLMNNFMDRWFKGKCLQDVSFCQ